MELEVDAERERTQRDEDAWPTSGGARKSKALTELEVESWSSIRRASPARLSSRVRVRLGRGDVTTMVGG